MLIFLQGTYLLFITCEFLVRGGSSLDLTGNCTFDQNQFCNWRNEKYADHFDWLQWQGSTPSSYTGPISDHSGNGSYIYIETSRPRKYNEKARLNSPWMRGAQRMTFYYSMYGSTVESLSVYVRINGSESRSWSRYRSHVSEDWIEACVTINHAGMYQVIIEGVAGLTYRSDIAIDDISFSKNLTCVSTGRNMPAEKFEANCTFDKSYCGWRNLLSPQDNIQWIARRSSTPSPGTGPSQDHTGKGYYIYIEASQPAKEKHSAQLLSPLVRGPKCFRFYYHMYGSHIGKLCVFLQIQEQYGNYLMWQKSGEQGNQWREANVDIDYASDFQVVLNAVVGSGFRGDIAVDDVTFTDGLCESGSESRGGLGNCTFDQNQFCNWRNEKYADHFDWLQWQGSTPSSNTGPISDHSGNGSYIYIETSGPRKYNEKARLNSPWMRGAQRMTFYYSMYGSTVESLSVYVRNLTGSESRAWSRYRSHVSEDWIEACLAINYAGMYQVIIEGVAGLTFRSDIAIDDISFSKNLTCISTGRNMPAEKFEANCTFDKSYCGWRNVLSPQDDIQWIARRSRTPSPGTGPSQDHTGKGYYIYIEASQPAKEKHSAQLLSPLVRGPKCFRFYYHMYGRHIGKLCVFLQIREQYGNYLMWQKSGEQGNQWREANVDIGYTSEFQVVLNAVVGSGFRGDIAVDDVTFTDGLCESGSESRGGLGNCNFDVNFCFWRNVFYFQWTLKQYATPSLNTGPYADHTSGTGKYIYIETSSPRKPRDIARLEGPWMRGPQCMTFYYHMRGSTMSCVIIYIRSRYNRYKLVWLKSEDRGDHWIPGQISINTTEIFQIIIYGIRGSSFLGDAALDDFFFKKGTCQQKVVTTFYVSSFLGRDFRLSSQPFEHSRYSEEFRFTLEHPSGNPKERPYFIYSGLYSKSSFVTSSLDLSNTRNFPLDVVVLGIPGSNSMKINFINRSPYGPMISVGDYTNDYCCARKIMFSFYALNVTKPDSLSSDGCEPGWYKANKSCHLFSFKYSRQWGDARTICHLYGAELAVVNDARTVQDLANQRRELNLDDRDLYLGLSGQLKWIWSDGSVVSNNTPNQWGPNEPSDDGKCGALLNAIRWDSNWKGYGWRWNDIPCTSRKGYICQQMLDVPLPVALFSLSGTNGTVDRSPNGAIKAVSNNVKFAPGPYGNPNGSFYFSGINSSSYVKLTKSGQLDTRFSIGVFAWVHLGNSSGPIYTHELPNKYYGLSLRVSSSILGVKVRYVDRKTLSSYLLSKENVLEPYSWNFIGTTYDYQTGVASIFVNNNTVMLKYIKAKMELATYSLVRIGAMKKQKVYFRGRISCLQVYDQALSVDQIIKVKARCNQSAPLICSHDYFAFHGGCFSINTKNMLTWNDALEQCRREGGTLAKISREGLRYAFTNRLEEMRPKPEQLHFGLFAQDNWVWIDGSPFNDFLWLSGYPSAYHGIQSCAVLSAGSSGIKNVDCRLMKYPLCQKKLVNSLSHLVLTQTSSVLLPYYPSLAMDRSYTTCFRSQKESNPWWKVTFEKSLYVESVEITNKVDCCPRDKGMINVSISTSKTGSNPTCTESMQYGVLLIHKAHCSPPARGRYVTVTLTGNNVTLVLCQVVVRTIEFPEEAHGVLREAWYNVDYNSKNSPTMRGNPVFEGDSQSQITLQEFDAPVNVGTKYVQRLTSYLQVPESGNYTFYLSCDEFCELWKHNVIEKGIEKEDRKAEEIVTKQPIISVKRFTTHQEWDRYQEQISQTVFLDKCRIYRMEAFMREESGNDHISVGMRTPSGEYERPIPGTRLFRIRPGTRKLEVTLWHHKTSLSAFVGSDLRISGYYRFCCEGVYCPDCPLELNISTLGQNVTVNSALSLSCVNTSFTATLNTNRQSDNFTIKASYSFVNNSEQIVSERVLGHLHLRAVVIKECYFKPGYCGWTSLGDNEEIWRVSNIKTFVKFPGHFAYIGDSFKAKLEGPLLPWKPFHKSVGLCLRFNYLITQSKSSLKIFLREPNREKPVLVWQLVGNHGEKWSAAQVAWSGAKGIQVIFEGEGFVHKKINVAIDDVIITTENCSLRPYFAKPGFKCSDSKFTCNNGECVKKNLLCDGDFACKDGSDEDNCECPSSMFNCREGGCILATSVCDGTNDCSNGDDENNCRNPCNSRYQCVDGSCISWSNTCSQTAFCRDGTNTPSVCGSGKCHLDDLACTSKNSSEQKRCRSFRGHCNFQSGLCGLKPDKSATFHWTVGSGQTPTESTGPSYDHTSLNKDGSYIFIEVSRRNPGEKARLLSGWIEANETVCVQFWYHMHGSDIGNLNIYVKTNQSETLVWRLSGDQGNRWRFGQTALNSPSLYKFVLEGTVGGGSKGDVAVDDLTVLDGFCETILKQTSPDCYFEESMCDWKADEEWVLHSYQAGLGKRGGYVSLAAGAFDSVSFLSSPVFNTHTYEWKCLRFCYLISVSATLIVLLDEKTTNQTKLLLFPNKLTHSMRYMQFPLPRNFTNAQIHFVGSSKFSFGLSLAIDDVSFSKEPCQKIPVDHGKACQEALGMENGAILDGQITASSQWDDNHAPFQGRLHFKKSGTKQGSWSASTSDAYQWLQIDLVSQYIEVTGVATQGRNAFKYQYITKYKLQYSGDGVNFQYYKERGEIADKEFNGNADEDSVVYHELYPAIRTRYIRFRPVAWYGAISMRVELYGCKDVGPCDISVDWCGWKSVRGWKRIKYQELDQDYQDLGGTNGTDNGDGDDDDDDEDDKGDPSDSVERGIFDRGNYEIHLPDIDLGYVSFSDVSPLHVGFTLCFWLKTEHSGFFIEYKVATEENETLVLGVYCRNHTFVFKLKKTKRKIPMGVTDNTWHHVCVLWTIRDEEVEVFKDGERKYVSTGFQSSSRRIGIEGGGTMTIGFRESNASVVLGVLTGFNLWSYAVTAGEILRMSHGCGTETGDVKAWQTVRNGLQKEVAVVRPRTCKDRKGDRLVVGASPTRFNKSAVLVSPVYNRSPDWYSKCLRFRYMLRGPGKKQMTIFHKTDSYREIPIWISKRNTDKSWVYGQVSLSSVSKFQVLIKGEAEENNGLIALTGLYIDEGTHCTHEPPSAKKACNENLFNMSGYFFSPSFPGYYFGDIFCTWHITVPSGYIIHLEFQEFRLKDHPMCENCFLQIFDGRDTTAPAIGKFCGYVYPPHFVSSSNHFTIVLDCQGDLRAVGFKAFYRSVAASDDLASSCSRQQGCPSSCKCEELYEGPEKTILVTGEDLVTVPSKLPSKTGAVFFQKNRISQIREMDFKNLTKLKYIDLSFNILLHVDEHSFQNLPFVNTLRLNSNFFRTLPVGGFTGLPNLRVLDLGWNLLHQARSGMLDGLTSLEVLSLRSNQIEGMEYGVFDNKSNLTHLYLQENKLTTLPSGLFGTLSKLKVLDLSSNQLTTVTKGTFQGLESLEYLYLNSNKLFDVPSDAFSELKNIKYLKLDRFILCCYAKKSIVGVDCESPVDEFSSCDDLMKNKTVQICIWILGILAFLGNLLVIIWRALDKEENRVQSFLLTNLAVADLLMGVYLLTIAIMDLRWQGEYFMHDIEWRSGMGCRISGVLSMLSSEVSVLILTIITMDRLICIVFPFKFNRLTYRAAVLACIGVWTFGVVISVIPITGINYFYGDESAGNFGFYSRSAVCLPLQLSGGRPAGWEYSVAFFVCLNFISFTFILVAYMTMFWTVKRASRAARSTNLNKESAMAKRLVFIVMTDFCCWMPIIIINILSLTGNFDDPNKIAYVWIAVFVLPLNSSLNPILYTFSTDRTKRSLVRKRKNVSSLAMRTLHSRLPGRKQSVDWLKTSDNITLVTNVVPGSSDSIPLPSPRPEAGTRDQDSNKVHAKLKLIEDANILQDDTAGKRSTGYAVAWCEQENFLSMVLLKYFAKEYKTEWLAEVDTVQGMFRDVEPLLNLLHYRWHSKARDQIIEHGKVKIRELRSNSLLICYNFVSSSTLEDFLCEKGTVLNFDAVCAIACDVISAIERLQDLGILHNNITTSNILIGQCQRLPPVRAVLGGFSRASKMNEAGAFTNWAADEQSDCGNDIEQFGQLLATLLGHCHGSSEYIKLHEIMNLCFEETVENRPTASYIRELLEEAWFCVGVWDTCL